MMITNYKDFKKFIEGLTYRPKLLLHACCAPCSSHCIDLLMKYFDITIYFSNDNIYPKEEYDTRLLEIKRFSQEFGLKTEVMDEGYHHEDFEEAIKGKEMLGEKTIRCYECYKERLRKTAIYAKKNGFEFFTTTLSISPYKVTKWLNEIGEELAKEYDIPYLYSDFKKENGYLHSVELSDQYGLYRQDYCGCEHSIRERNDQNEN